MTSPIIEYKQGSAIKSKLSNPFATPSLRVVMVGFFLYLTNTRPLHFTNWLYWIILHSCTGVRWELLVAQLTWELSQARSQIESTAHTARQQLGTRTVPYFRSNSGIKILKKVYWASLKVSLFKALCRIALPAMRHSLFSGVGPFPCFLFGYPIKNLHCKITGWYRPGIALFGYHSFTGHL